MPKEACLWVAVVMKANVSMPHPKSHLLDAQLGSNGFILWACILVKAVSPGDMHVATN